MPAVEFAGLIVKNMDLIHRYRGSLLGLAPGDALGTTLPANNPEWDNN